jgi:replicative DNA helicase
MADSSSPNRRAQSPSGDASLARPAGLGRTAPHSTEAEESLLACCLLDGGDSVSACLEGRLAPESFYSPSNRLMFEVVCDIYRLGHPIDAAVLSEEFISQAMAATDGVVAKAAQVLSMQRTTLVEKIGKYQISG